MADEVIIDRTLPMGSGQRGIQISPEEVLMAAARMQRDGASLRQIKVQMQLVGVDDPTLQRALDRGAGLLAARIAAGLEPEESQVRFAAEPPVGAAEAIAVRGGRMLHLDGDLDPEDDPLAEVSVRLVQPGERGAYEQGRKR